MTSGLTFIDDVSTFRQAFSRSLFSQQFSGYCEPLPETYEVQSTWEIPDMEVKFRETSVDFRMLDTNEEFVISKEALHTISHEYVFYLISNNTDMKISLIKALGDHTDHMTPDLIRTFSSLRKFYIAEFATCFLNSPEAMMQEYNKKLSKYREQLKLRTEGDNCIFNVIVVNDVRVVSNLRMEQIMIDKLCHRYKVSKAMINRLHDAGLYCVNKEDIDRFSQCKRILSSMNPVFTESRIFTEALYSQSKSSVPFERKKEIEDQIVGEMLKCFHESKKEANSDGHFNEVERAIEKVSVENNVTCNRLDPKSVINLPFLSPYYVAGNEPRLPEIPRGLGDSEVQLINEAANNSFLLEDTFSEDLDKELSQALQDSDLIPFNVNKVNYHRVPIDLTSDHLIQLAKTGWCGKKYKDETEVKQYRLEKKGKFSLNVDTSDIDDFINNINIYEYSYNYLFETSYDLIKRASEVYKEEMRWVFTDHIHEYINFFMNTHLGLCLSTLTSMAAELAVSRLQFTKAKECLVKRVRDTPIHLIIHPTSPNNPICFLIVSKAESLQLESIPRGNVFRDMKHHEGVLWTQVISCNISKLVNWIKAESIGLALFFFACDYWNVLPSDLNSRDGFCVKLQKAMRLTNLLIMIHLHDKKSTEEVFTDFRYLILEGFKFFPEKPNPSELVERLNPYPKNRLEVWAIKKFFEEARRIVNINGFLSFPNFGICESNLRCPFTGDQMIDPQQLLNVFYYGYLCNKEEIAEKNSLAKLLVKILAQEELYDPDSPYYGCQDPRNLSELKVHQFSRDFLFMCVDHVKEQISKKVGIECEKYMEDQIIRLLSHDLLVDIATLKASSNFTEEWEMFDPSKSYHRSKVSEKLFEIIGPNDNMVVDVLPKCLEKLEQRGCLPSCLFRKAQHGGLREIFVLTIEARVCQRVLEMMARCICSFFPSETMTHPDNKYNIPDGIKRTVNDRLGPYQRAFAVSVSDDAEKWSQRHTSSKFFLMMSRMLPDYMRPFLFRAFALWEKKKLMIDPTLLKVFDRIQKEGKSFGSYDEVIQKLYKAFCGVEQCPWMPGEKMGYIQIRSGMMQGILHYTSSALHTIYLEWLQDFYERTFDEFKTQHMSKNFQMDMFHLQSSDDSSISLYITLGKDDQHKVKNILLLTDTLFRLKGKLSKWLGIYESRRKKKQNTINFMEFNSEFYIGSNVYKPTVKFVISAIHISENESLVARQEECYNLITSIPENGGSFLLASGCQHAQAFLHYRLLGASLSCLFPRYSSAVYDTMDPACGFFLLDYPAAAGVGGFSYLNYVVTKFNRNLQSKMKVLLSGLRSENFSEGDEQFEHLRDALETTTSGLFTKGVCIPIGDRRRWIAMIKRLVENSPLIGIDDQQIDWKTYIDTDPSLLYRKPTNGIENKVAIMLKLHSPGVSESLGKGNALPRIMAMGVYILSRAVMSKRSLYFDEDDLRLEFKHEKRSLLFYSCRVYDMAETLDEDDWSLLFPYQDEYDSLNERLEIFCDGPSKLVPLLQNRRKVRSTIKVYANVADAEANMEMLACDKWFGTNKCRMSKTMHSMMWNRAKNKIRWLRDDVQETLNASPFKDHVTLRNYLSSIVPKRRTLRLNGTPAKRVGGVSNLISALTYDIWGGMQYVSNQDLVAFSMTTQYSNAYHCLRMLSKFPGRDRSATAIEIIKRLVPDDPTPRIRSRRAVMKILKHFLISGDIASTYNMILEYKSGVIGTYTVRQERDPATGKYYGPGEWTGYITGIPTRIHIMEHRGVCYLHSVELTTRMEGQVVIDWFNTLKHFLENESILMSWPMSYFEPQHSSTHISVNKLEHAGGSRNLPALRYNPFYVCTTVEHTVGLNVEITDYSLLLKASCVNIRGEISKHTVLSMSFAGMPINQSLGSSTIDFITSEALKCWIMRVPLQPKLAMKVFNTLSCSDDASDHIWLKTLLQSSLQRNSVIHYHDLFQSFRRPADDVVKMDSPEQASVTYENVVGLFTDETNIRNFKDFVSGAGEEFSEGTTEMFDESWLEGLQEQFAYTSNRIEDLKVEIKDHPYFDLLSKLFHRYSLSNIRRLLDFKEVLMGQENSNWKRVIAYACDFGDRPIHYVREEEVTETVDI